MSADERRGLMRAVSCVEKISISRRRECWPCYDVGEAELQPFMERPAAIWPMKRPASGIAGLPRRCGRRFFDVIAVGVLGEQALDEARAGFERSRRPRTAARCRRCPRRRTPPGEEDRDQDRRPGSSHSAIR